MNILELTSEIRRTIYDRQNGMCAYSGKKFEEFNDSIDVDYIAVDGDSANNDNIIMLWKQHNLSPKTTLRKYLFPYANIVSYSIEHKITDFKQDIGVVTTIASTDPDLRKVRNSINDLTNLIIKNTSGITGSQRTELRTQLHAALSIINQRQDALKEKNSEE